MDELEAICTSLFKSSEINFFNEQASSGVSLQFTSSDVENRVNRKSTVSGVNLLRTVRKSFESLKSCTQTITKREYRANQLQWPISYRELKRDWPLRII